MKKSKLLWLKIAFAFSLFSFTQLKKEYGTESYSLIEQNNKKGLVNEKGDIIIPVKYDDLGWSRGGLHIIENTVGYKDGYQWGLIDLNDKKITKAQYFHLYPFYENLLIAASQDHYTRYIRYGVINTKGKTEVSFKYDHLLPFQHLLIARESKNGTSMAGVINSHNKTLIPFQYKHISGIGKSHFSVQDEKQKVALFGMDGKQLSKFIYDSIAAFSDDALLVFDAGKKGLITATGQTLLPPQYKSIEANSPTRINVQHYPEWTILNSQNEILKTMNYDDISPLGQNYYKIKAEERQGVINSHDEMRVPLREWQIINLKYDLITFYLNGKYGVLDLTGKTIIPAQYDHVELHKDYIIASRVILSEIRYSLFNKKGELISKDRYTEILQGNEDIFPVKHKEKWGFINNRGEEVIICKFDSVLSFAQGKAKVYYLGGCGIIDQKGSWLIKPFYEDLNEVQGNNTYLYSKGHTYTFIDEREEKIYRTTNHIYKHDLGFVEKEEDGKSRLIRADGSSVFEHHFDSVSALLSDTVLYLYKNGETAIITKKGKFLMKYDKRFQEIHPPSENFIGCKIGGKYGFVDMNGKLRIANQYEAIGKFSEGLTCVKIMSKWGFIDKAERWIIQPFYEYASDFKNGISVIKKNGKYGLINKEGENILPYEYDKIEELPSGNYRIYKNNLAGLVNARGKLILHAKFDHLSDLNNGFVVVEREQKKGLISNKGVSTIPMVYDDILYDSLNEVYIIARSGSWETINMPKAK